MTECTATIAHRNHTTIFYHRELGSRTFAAFMTVCNQCKRVMKSVKNSFTQSFPANIEIKKLCSREFIQSRKHHLLKRGKSLMLTIINDFEAILSSSDKAKLIAMHFASNSALDDKVYPLPDFPARGVQTM